MLPKVMDVIRESKEIMKDEIENSGKQGMSMDNNDAHHKSVIVPKNSVKDMLEYRIKLFAQKARKRQDFKDHIKVQASYRGLQLNAENQWY